MSQDRWDPAAMFLNPIAHSPPAAFSLLACFDNPYLTRMQAVSGGRHTRSFAIWSAISYTESSLWSLDNRKGAGNQVLLHKPTFKTACYSRPVALSPCS